MTFKDYVRQLLWFFGSTSESTVDDVLDALSIVVWGAVFTVLQSAYNNLMGVETWNWEVLGTALGLGAIRPVLSLLRRHFLPETRQ